MDQLIECVPNFSEGRDSAIIQQIANAIKAVPGVQLLHVDPGMAANRTVMTFVGTPKAVVEAAFQAVKTAADLIDMRTQHGEHPRMGATDVCPLIPISNVSMEEMIVYARQLAERIGRELNISIYCYEFAAQSEERRSLANCRSGEYEGMREKLKSPGWKPDFGPKKLNEKAGVTAVSARNFLIAYNVNLNTSSVGLANSIAAEVRESGRVLRAGNDPLGPVLRGQDGKVLRVAGKLKKLRAIGWYIREYGKAQVSMNLIDKSVTPIHAAFDAVREAAAHYGVEVTGSELIGLIPLDDMLNAGRYFRAKQGLNVEADEALLVQTAITELGLAELAPFKPNERIIEYAMQLSPSV